MKRLALIVALLAAAVMTAAARRATMSARRFIAFSFFMNPGQRAQVANDQCGCASASVDPSAKHQHAR